MQGLSHDMESTPEHIKKALISKKYVPVICGPTCVGKSRVASALARQWKTDIISADSMQVYKEMDIGTDKQHSPDFKLYMTDLFTPDHHVTAVQFKKICRKIIEDEFFAKGKIPVVAGGSGLYIRAVMDKLKFAPPRDSQLREQLRQKIKHYGLEKYYQLLEEVDRPYSQKISSNDARRIIRGLEVYYLSGKPFSSFQDNWNERQSIYNSIFIGLNQDRQLLYKKIDNRVDQMFERGLVSEVKALVDQGYEASYPLKQAVGYKEVVSYVKGQIDLKKCRELVKRNTRRLAKKQLTWFRKDPRINWIRVDNYDNICSLQDEIKRVIEKRLND